jgi:hypothetical protein
MLKKDALHGGIFLNYFWRGGEGSQYGRRCTLAGGFTSVSASLAFFQLM